MFKNISAKLFDIFRQYHSKEMIANLDAKVIKYKLNEVEIITTVVDDIKPNCYVASIYNATVAYAEDELSKITIKYQKIISKILIKLFSFILKVINIDKIQMLNNYMLSTNFYPESFNSIDLQKLREMAINDYPAHTLLLRSVNNIQNHRLYCNLLKDNWLPITFRQVYLFNDYSECDKHINYRRDKKLRDDKRYEFIEVDIENFALFERAVALYNQLYLDKYSQHNVQFTPLYLQELVKKEILHLRMLYDHKYNKYVGVVGLIGEDNIVTAPIVGYDFSYSKKEALYRRVIAYAIEYARDNKLQLNLSSGAGQFKVGRGATAELEYIFVYTKHLSIVKRVIWYLVSIISNHFYAGLLKKLKL